jgi:hypothetical protein
MLNQNDRAHFIVNVEKMSFRETILALDSPEGRRFPVVIIDEWRNRAIKEKTMIYNWLRLEFEGSVPIANYSYHEKNQMPIQELFGIKK